ncbi:MAG: methytransferase partner Trm112 [Dehalococcoidales bacterium]|nr:methytransferase partner Trm112 [Dehalococcoidales bacterium]
MKRELMAILACPLCKGEFELKVEAENKEEIVSGSLHCLRCHQQYPITDTLPNLLPPDQRG